MLTNYHIITIIINTREVEKMKYLSLYKAFTFYNIEEFNKLYEQRYNSEATIKLFLKIHDYTSFIFFPNELNILVNSIRILDKKIENIFSQLPNVAKNQYTKKSMIDEIQFNNSIEGVISTRKEINEIIEEIKLKNNKQKRLQGIINKYIMLANQENIKLESAEDIRIIYDEMLYDEIRQSNENNLPDGKLFRKDIVNVTTTTGKVIHTGIVPEEKIISSINEAIKILNNENYDALIRVALFHYIFAYIHPFYDGNGRINRFISSYILSKNYISIIGYRLSLTIKENLSDYYDAFKNTNDIRNKGDITLFVIEFLKIILKAYEKTELYALNKLKSLNRYNELISNKNLDQKLSNLLYILVQVEMFSEFGLSITELATVSELSPNTIRNKLKILKGKNLVKEINVGKRIYYSANLENLE